MILRLLLALIVVFALVYTFVHAIMIFIGVVVIGLLASMFLVDVNDEIDYD